MYRSLCQPNPALPIRSASAVPHPRSTSKKNSLSQALPSATPGLHAAQRHEDPGIDVGDSHNAPQVLVCHLFPVGHTFPPPPPPPSLSSIGLFTATGQWTF